MRERFARKESPKPWVLYWPKVPVSHFGPDPKYPQALSPLSDPIIDYGYLDSQGYRSASLKMI